MTCLDDCPSCSYQPFTIASWHENLKCVRHKSARGACGYTPRELLILPDVVTEWLFQLFDVVESGNRWPSIVTIARVVFLPKSSMGAIDPLDTRPITILSRLYRAWSRFRSMQVANHLMSMMPPTIGGSLNGASADLISAFTVNAIDDAYEAGQNKCGIVVDLAKCFNTIARYPILKLMKKLGMPPEYSNGLFMMLHHLSRYLEINADIDLLVPSTTGIPEGDAFSVTLMTALTFWVHMYIEQYHDIDATFYVDNWSFIAEDVESLVAASQTMIDFVRDMQLVISYQKSWVWATSKALRKQLKSTLFGGCTVPLQYHATDLGCDMNYCKRRYKKTTKGRVATSIRRLGRVSTKKLPKSFRVKMAQTLG